MLDMNEVFYIIETKGGIFQVRLSYNYECMATALSLEEALEKIKALAERYGTTDSLIEKWNNSDLKPSRSHTLEYNKKMYEEEGSKYLAEIQNMFEVATTPKLIKRKIKTTTPTIENKEAKEDIPSAPIIKPKKRIIFKK